MEDIRAVACLLSACPGCQAEAGDPWPDGATTRHCPCCLDRIRRVYQIQRWNADHAHQVRAGRASWSAFSARWRASSGLPPLADEHIRRYVTPMMIRGPLGIPLPARLQATVYRAWYAGILEPGEAWCADDPPPEPEGLWAAAPSAARETQDAQQEGSHDV